MFEHTPRPWKLDPDPVTCNADKDEQLYVVDGPDWGFIVATDLRLGDARLIAAAPEMLDSLEYLATRLDSIEDIRIAQEAIAKAKGETE